MHQYDNMISTQIVTDYGQVIATATTTTSATNTAMEVVTTCYKRHKDKDHEQKIEGQRGIGGSGSETHQFPEDEEPNVLGHGTTAADDGEREKPNACSSIMSEAEKLTNKFKILLSFEDAPDHLKFNPYIRGGYRTFLSTKHCLWSVFWWTNETINIWSHLVGCILFIGLTIFDLQFLQAHAEFSDQVLVVCLLICFCLCMLLSSVYHIFSCKSEQHYDFFLSVDFLGISLSLIAIYISGMYYAFWCFTHLRFVYSVIALSIFSLAMLIQVPKFKVSLNARIVLLLGWAAYGVVPMIHWSVVMGGLENELVQLMVPRVVIMYILCIIAFVFYAARIPERWLTGKVDFVGHSHNWWHLFIVGAFYHWHNTGIVYAEYRLNNGCSVPAFT